jgi:hypothetical protein
MIYVGLLTLEQADEINGKEYAPDSFYNVITDFNENFVISTEEIDNTINPLYLWVKNLPLIEYISKQIDF